MRKLNLSLLVILVCLGPMACKSDHQDVVKQVEQSKKDVDTAKAELAKSEREAQSKVNKAESQGDLKQIEDAKIAATKDLATAENKVDTTKVDETKEVEDAKHNAGETSGTYQRK